MASITEVRDRFVKILAGFNELIVGTYKDTEADAIDMNTQQMRDGVTSLGKGIGQYSSFTKQIKKAKGQNSEWVTLLDTGEFQSAMGFQTLDAQYASINSSDWKTDGLVDKYGADIFGLTEKNTKIYARENWFTSFMEKLKTILYGRN